MKWKRYAANYRLITIGVLLASATVAWAATEQVIHNFGISPGNGSQPVSGLIRDAAGKLYGVTSVGGDFNVGTVFELSPLPGGGWKRSILYSFGSVPNDGGNPQGRLAFDSAGNLYGATFSGETKGVGVVFQLSPTRSGTWNETVIHNFTGGAAGSADGGSPEGGVVVGAAGNVYGTTDEGGSMGVGIVYELSPSSGWSETVLHHFLQRADGGNPIGDLTVDRRGRLYGVTFIGSNIFRLTQNPTTKKWNFKTLFTFQNNKANGAPNPDLAVDAHFHIFGAMSHGAPNAVGTVFELSLSAGVWTLNYLYGFSGGSDGGFPNVGFIDTGSLYGTTPLGGTKQSWCRLPTHPERRRMEPVRSPQVRRPVRKRRQTYLSCAAPRSSTQPVRDNLAGWIERWQGNGLANNAVVGCQPVAVSRPFHSQPATHNSL